MAAPLEIGGIEIPWTNTFPPEDETFMAPYVKQKRQTQTLQKGWQKTKEHRPLPCDIIFDENVEIFLRDGIKIYCDIIRPVTKEEVPALLAVSPYGKGGHGFLIFESSPFRIGVPISTTSGLEKFESLDPAEWASRGYAMVNVDIRGSWESEGNVYIEGSQPGVDVSDMVEHIAKLDWCNGSLGMQGNSWLAASQWSAAVQCPPSLKAIAPWEGFTDKYRDVVCRGGIPKTDFANFVFDKTIRGRQKREDIGEALRRHPLMNAYWEDKRLDVSKINIPVYAVASYSSGIHGFGTVRGFNEAGTSSKWLRFHATQEWYDLYLRKNNDDLQKFFDRYLKGIQNGWEETTPVRVSVLTYGNRFEKQPIENIPFDQYPPKETQYRTVYLSPSATMEDSPAREVSTASYQSDELSAKAAEFIYTFKENTTLIGYAKAKLWLSCNDTDDMDVHLSLRKVDKDGKVREHNNVPWVSLPAGVDNQEDIPQTNVVKHLGPTGVLRISHRAQDPTLSTPVIPFHPHDKEEKVPPGTIVSAEIGFWPMGITFEKGEGLMLRIQGFLDQCNEFAEHIHGKPKNLNRGEHIVHIGGDHESSLILPVVPI
ncbi:hypothetical protein LTR84_011946 [Exophiala bonariae]|uniref:Xaa-Pro dipeptidyl-peptidase C-terminal domain-containing protein n=1 Tax=Exophiala bonariae TaxID=1690606 RepID=A0AAV9MRK0_9EURO|nr:hypothetical protein LTR84_011946 [Exophiala bonariae]